MHNCAIAMHSKRWKSLSNACVYKEDNQVENKNVKLAQEKTKHSSYSIVTAVVATASSTLPFSRLLCFFLHPCCHLYSVRPTFSSRARLFKRFPAIVFVLFFFAFGAVLIVCAVSFTSSLIEITYMGDNL